MAKRRFRDFSPRAQAALVALGILEVALFAGVQIDVSRRPADQVRGPKLRWRLLAFINVFGPLAYFRWGRMSAPEPTS